MTAPSALAFWARTHRVHARFVIAFSTTLLLVTAAALGNLWMTEGLRIGPGVLACIFAIYLLIFPLYPVLRRRKNWLRRKAFDAVLIGCTALLGIWLGTQPDTPRTLAERQTAVAATHRSAEATSRGSRTPAQLFEQKVQRGMALLKLVFRRPARFGDPALLDTATKIVLTLLATALMLGLMYVVFWVSCSLSCSGNAVGGTLVLWLGGLGVLTLFVLALIRIYRGQRWADKRRSR